jgi:hypothetical protein
MGQAQSRRSVGPAAERESPDQLGQRSGRGFASLAAQIIKTRDTLFNDDAGQMLLPPELQIARAIAAYGSRTATVIAPEVDGLAAQGIGAADPAFEPGAARQAHFKPALRTSAHRAAHALTTVAAIGRDVAYDPRRIAIGSCSGARR